MRFIHDLGRSAVRGGAPARQSPRVRGLLLASALVALPVTTSPAAAGDTGAGHVVLNACAPNPRSGHCLHGELVATIHPAGVNQSVVEFTCELAGYPGAVAVEITTCSVGGVGAVSTGATPGGASAQGAGIVDDAGTYTACIGGNAIFAESVLGPPAVSGTACGTITTIPTP